MWGRMTLFLFSEIIYVMCCLKSLNLKCPQFLFCAEVQKTGSGVNTGPAGAGNLITDQSYRVSSPVCTLHITDSGYVNTH